MIKCTPQVDAEVDTKFFMVAWEGVVPDFIGPWRCVDGGGVKEG